VNIRNVGAQTMNSVDIVYSVNGGTAQTYNWSGSLDYLAQDTVQLPPIAFTGQASNDLVVSTSNPNGNPDECTSNDQVTLAVPEAMHTPNTVKLILRTDSNPGQTTWQVTDAMGNVMYSGGPYSSSGQMIQETFEIADEACYTFTVFDSGGDGIASPGFYMLYYGSNTTISQGTDFGYQDQVDFNTADPVGIGEQAAKTGVTVYPNPVLDKATIVVTLDKASNVSYSIYSVSGQKMAESSAASMDAGQHGLVVDASNWQSGLYLYQVRVGEQTFTGKITVK
jgi:lysyl endopeptidase